MGGIQIIPPAAIKIDRRRLIPLEYARFPNLYICEVIAVGLVTFLRGI